MSNIVYEELFGDAARERLTKFDETVFKIRPSSIKSFFDFPSEWYKEFILKEGRVFEGNTSSVLGTVLHFCYECAFNNKALKATDVDEAIDLYNKNNPGLFSVEEVKELYPLMLEGILSDYITKVKSKGVSIVTEEEVIWNIKDNFVVRGLVDLRYGSVIADYKNVSKKPTNTETIPFDYKIQLLCYANALRKSGQLVDRIEIVYNVRPTKTLPSRQYVVREAIYPSDIQMVEDTINLIVESIEAVRENPKLTHLIFKSMKLKQEGK